MFFLLLALSFLPFLLLLRLEVSDVGLFSPEVGFGLNFWNNRWFGQEELVKGKSELVISYHRKEWHHLRARMQDRSDRALLTTS